MWLEKCVFRNISSISPVCKGVCRGISCAWVSECVYLVLGDFIHFTKRAVRSKQHCQEEEEVGERNPKPSPAIRWFWISDRNWVQQCRKIMDFKNFKTSFQGFSLPGGNVEGRVRRLPAIGQLVEVSSNNKQQTSSSSIISLLIIFIITIISNAAIKNVIINDDSS